MPIILVYNKLCTESYNAHMCIARVDWIEWLGKRYCIDDIVFCGFEDEKPKFGKIDKIITIKSQVFFALTIFVTKGTDHHHNSILIETSPSRELKQLTEDSALVCKQHSFQTHSLDSNKPGEYHIVTKYFLSKTY